jgi:GNAT superfamily N-acetyltransferase
MRHRPEPLHSNGQTSSSGENSSRRAGYVHKLAVRPTYAGEKIGAETLKWAESVARKAGKKFLGLNCLAEDRKIRDYYKRAGFL